MKIKKLSLILIALIAISLCGCWDKIEINERGFILGLGIDKLKEKEKEQEYDVIKVEFKVPNVALIGTKQSNVKEPSFYYEGKGESFDTVIDSVESSIPFRLDLSHDKAIVLGKNLLKDEKLFRDVLDGIERQKKLSRKIYIVSAKEDASEIIKIKPTENPLVGMYLRTVLSKGVEEGRVVDGTLNKVAKDVGQYKSTVLPIVQPLKKNKEIEIKGAAIIKDYKWVGEINDVEGRIYNLITRNNHNIVDYHVTYDDVVVTYNLNKTERKMKVSEKDNRLILNLNISTEGDISQHRVGIKGAIANDKAIKGVENLVQEAIENDAKNLISKFQNTYNTDVIGIREYLYKYNPKLYEKTSKDWDEYFKNMEVNVKVESKVRRIGIVR